MVMSSSESPADGSSDWWISLRDHIGGREVASRGGRNCQDCLGPAEVICARAVLLLLLLLCQQKKGEIRIFFSVSYSKTVFF